MKWFLVFIGSGIGGCLRLLTVDIVRKFYNTGYPTGTLLANIIACLLLGLIIGLADSKVLDDKMKLLLTVGLCGGYSTFSTFSYETVYLFSNQKVLEGSLYVAASIITCILAILLGTFITKQL